MLATILMGSHGNSLARRWWWAGGFLCGGGSARRKRGGNPWVNPRPPKAGVLMPDSQREELGNLIRQLEAQHPVLQQMSRELEKDFLKVGSYLERLTDGTSRLLARCEALRQLQTGGTAGDFLKPVMQLLNAPLEFLGRCNGCLQELTTELLTADRQIGGVLSSSADVSRALAPLAFMPVLFRMELVHLPAETQQMFVALTEEIQRLHGKFLETFAVRLDILDKSRGTVRLGISKLEELVSEHQRTTESQRLHVQQTLLALREELDRREARDTGLAQVSRNTSRKVGEIVVGLQSQDIISQRLAHVLAALGQLTDRYREARKDGDARVPGPFALYASQTARLQLAQLHGIVQDAARAEKTIQTGLQSILDSIVEMERGCELGADGAEASGAGPHAAKLSALVEALHEPLHGTQQRTAAVYDSIASLGGQTSDLTGTLRKLANDIWLSGLNAQVQAAKAAQGTGLEILSAKTSSIAEETKARATEVTTLVDALAGNFGIIIAKLDELRGQARAHQETLALGGGQHRRDLLELGRRTRADMQEVSGLATRVRETAVESQAAARLETNVSAAVRATTQILEKIGSLSQAIAGSLNCTAESESLLDELKGKYTMASEVAAYENTFAAAGSRAGTVPTPVEPAADSGAELFAEPGNAPEPVTDESSPAGNDGDAAATTAAQNLSAASRPEPPDSPGNNVELF